MPETKDIGLWQVGEKVNRLFGASGGNLEHKGQESRTVQGPGQDFGSFGAKGGCEQP